jgi:hypothetical protein
MMQQQVADRDIVFGQQNGRYGHANASAPTGEMRDALRYRSG